MKKKIMYTILFLSIVSIPFFVSAQIITGGGGGNTGASPTPNSSPLTVTITNPFKGGDTLSAIITAVLQNIIEPLAAVLVVVMIIYSGFKYITAQGKSAEIQKANQGLLYVLIGALILLGAAGISAAIQGTLCQLIPAGCP